MTQLLRHDRGMTRRMRPYYTDKRSLRLTLHLNKILIAAGSHSSNADEFYRRQAEIHYDSLNNDYELNKLENQSPEC
jgi:hypothetical protein